jgi:zinc transporter
MAIDRLRPALETGVPGCLWLLRFDAQGRAEPAAAEDMERIGESGEGYYWLHLDLADQRTRGLIERLNFLTAEARAPFIEPVDHQFIEHADNIVSGALLDHERGLSGRLSQTDYLRFAICRGVFVSARKRPLNIAEKTRNALSAGVRARAPLGLFETLVELMCDERAKMIRDLNLTLDGVEDRIIEGRGRDERATLGPARRDAVRLARQIGGLGSTLLRLEQAANEPEHEELGETAARLVQRVDALLRDNASIQDRARLLQDELNAILNLETNDRLYLLTVVTTLLLPATFVTGYFGMNTKQLPLADHENGSFYATLLCLVASAAVYLLMRSFGLTRRSDSEPAPRPAQKNSGAQVDRGR